MPETPPESVVRQVVVRAYKVDARRNKTQKWSQRCAGYAEALALLAQIARPEPGWLFEIETYAVAGGDGIDG